MLFHALVEITIKCCRVHQSKRLEWPLGFRDEAGNVLHAVASPRYSGLGLDLHAASNKAHFRLSVVLRLTLNAPQALGFPTSCIVGVVIQARSVVLQCPASHYTCRVTGRHQHRSQDFAPRMLCHVQASVVPLFTFVWETRKFETATSRTVGRSHKVSRQS